MNLIVKKCQRLDVLTNGESVQYLNTTDIENSNELSIYGEHARYTCANGYYLECQVDEDWTNEINQCLSIHIFKNIWTIIC